MMFFCQHAEWIWKAAPIKWDGLLSFRQNFWLWWTTLMEAKGREDGEQHSALTVNILWQIWKSRNQMQFKKVRKCPA